MKCQVNIVTTYTTYEKTIKALQIVFFSLGFVDNICKLTWLFSSCLVVCRWKKYLLYFFVSVIWVAYSEFIVFKVELKEFFLFFLCMRHFFVLKLNFYTLFSCPFLLPSISVLQSCSTHICCRTLSQTVWLSNCRPSLQVGDKKVETIFLLL